jgi:hypothetical protein
MSNYIVDDQGRPSHKCEGVTGWDDIYAERNGEWTLSLSAGDAKATIKYCPWCGIDLKISGE